MKERVANVRKCNFQKSFHTCSWNVGRVYDGWKWVVGDLWAYYFLHAWMRIFENEKESFEFIYALNWIQAQYKEKIESGWEWMRLWWDFFNEYIGPRLSLKYHFLDYVNKITHFSWLVFRSFQWREFTVRMDNKNRSKRDFLPWEFCLFIYFVEKTHNADIGKGTF